MGIAYNHRREARFVYIGMGIWGHGDLVEGPWGFGEGAWGRDHGEGVMGTLEMTSPLILSLHPSSIPGSIFPSLSSICPTFTLIYLILPVIHLSPSVPPSLSFICPFLSSTCLLLSHLHSHLSAPSCHPPVSFCHCPDDTLTNLLFVDHLDTPDA